MFFHFQELSWNQSLQQSLMARNSITLQWFQISTVNVAGITVQSSTESIAEFVADLRRLSINCEFGNFLSEALRDRFVCGVKDEQIQKKLLAEDGLTVACAIEIAKGMEAAAKNSKELHQDPSTTADSEIARVSGSGSGPPKKAEKTCYHCGRNHDEKDSQFHESKCHRCGKQGTTIGVAQSATSTLSNTPNSSLTTVFIANGTNLGR